MGAPLPRAAVAARLRMVAWVRRGMVAELLLTGPGFAFGPPLWSSASGYNVIHAFPVPIQVWGWAWMIAATMIAAGRWSLILRAAGHALAAATFLFWGFALAAPIVIAPPVTGWGGPWHHLALGAIHLWLVAAALYDREYRVETTARPHPTHDERVSGHAWETPHP